MSLTLEVGCVGLSQVSRGIEVWGVRLGSRKLNEKFNRTIYIAYHQREMNDPKHLGADKFSSKYTIVEHAELPIFPPEISMFVS